MQQDGFQKLRSQSQGPWEPGTWVCLENGEFPPGMCHRALWFMAYLNTLCQSREDAAWPINEVKQGFSSGGGQSLQKGVGLQSLCR